MTHNTEPPRFARKLLERVLPPDVREDLSGDLEEVFRRRCANHGAAHARFWYWREAVSFAGRFLMERRRERREHPAGYDRTDGVRSIPIGQTMRGGVSWLDFKLGFRMLIKYPVVTLVGGLAIAIGVTISAVYFDFSLLTMPTLPFEDGERIVSVRNWDVTEASAEPTSLRDFVTWRNELDSVEDLAAVSSREYHVSTEGGPSESVPGARVTASMFRLLRVRPLLGRPLVEADEEEATPAAVVIGHDLWQRLFDGDRSVIGTTIRLGNSTSTVVGVMPAGFGFPFNQEIWVPLRSDPPDDARSDGPPLAVFGRLVPAFTRAEAQAELTAIGLRTAAAFPATNEHLRPRVGSFLELDQGKLVRAANAIFILVLVVVCANVATLVFARTAMRQGEIALRSALGASRRRIVLQLFTEALVLTMAASAIGLAAAARILDWGMDLLWEVEQSRPPFWFDDSLSLTTVLYTAGLALFAAAIVGGVPALKATGRRIQPRLAQSGSRLRFGAVSTGAIIVQVALCVAFLPFAIVQGRDALPDRAAGDGAGFPVEEFLSGRLTRPPDAPLRSLSPAEREAFRARTAELQDELKRRLAAEPGLTAVTFTDRIPGFNQSRERIHIEGDVVPPDSTFDHAVRTLAVDLEFFGVMNARIVSGRAFAPGDFESDSDVVILGEQLARDIFKGRNAVGQRIRFPDRGGAEGQRWHQVIGVVRDPAMIALGPGEYVGLYRPLAPGEAGSVQMFLRASSNPDALVPRIRSLVASVDPSLVVDELVPLEDVWRPVLRSDRFFVVVLTVVSTVALALSLAGIYALVSFTVAQRSREIAIRTALGTHPRRIVAAIFGRALAQVGLGVFTGGLLISLTILDTRSEVWLVVTVGGLVTAAALLACVAPAMRALRIQPAEALWEA